MKIALIYFLIPFMMVGFCVLLGGIIALKDYYLKNHIDFSDIWESLVDSGIMAFIGCCIVGGTGIFVLWGRSKIFMISKKNLSFSSKVPEKVSTNESEIMSNILFILIIISTIILSAGFIFILNFIIDIIIITLTK